MYVYIYIYIYIILYIYIYMYICINSIPRKKVLLSAVDDRWSQVQSYRQLHSHLKSHAGLSHELGEDGVATFCAMFMLGLLLVHISSNI